MRRILLLTFSIPFVFVLPVAAQLGEVWVDFQAYSIDLQNYLNTYLNKSLSPLQLQAQTAIESSKGDLSIPNPNEARNIISSSLVFNSVSDEFENNSAVQGSLVSNEIDRLITRGAVEGFIGSSGQIRYKSKLENTEIALVNISNISQEADGIFNQILGISPENTAFGALLGQNQANLSLQTIKIQNEQARIMAENLAQVMQNNQFLQYSNLNLANISRQVEQANQTRRVDTAAEAARLLRTSAQIDLFGREYLK